MGAQNFEWQIPLLRWLLLWHQLLHTRSKVSGQRRRSVGRRQHLAAPGGSDPRRRERPSAARHVVGFDYPVRPSSVRSQNHAVRPFNDSIEGYEEQRKTFDLISQQEVLHVTLGCHCLLSLLNCSHENVPLRLYLFESRWLARSGLNHQLSNLKAILTEGLGLGRAVLLDNPHLTARHNFQKPFQKRRWTDFISFTNSKLVMRKRNGIVCKTTLDNCVAELDLDQHELLKRAPHQTFSYYQGPVSPEANKRHGLLVRRAKLLGHYSNSKKKRFEQSNLVKHLPGLDPQGSPYTVTLNYKPSRAIELAVEPVTAWLKSTTMTGDAAVIHVRRGDKVTSPRWCPEEVDRATSSANIAKMLAQAGVLRGSSVYIMTNEANLSHFDDLSIKWGYTWRVAAQFPHLASLVDGCRDEDSEGKMCENYFLFWIENHIMLSVDINRRIPTIMTKQQRIPSPFYLPHDFWLMRDFWNTSGCDRGRTRQAIEARDRL